MHVVAHILVVDDNRDLLAFLKRRLELESHSVATAENGKLALEAVQEQMPDLIVLDIMMPVMDGFECNLRLKEDLQTANIPVVMLTAKSETTDKLTALFTGACEYITKPFKSEELLEAIHRLLSQETVDPTGEDG